MTTTITRPTEERTADQRTNKTSRYVASIAATILAVAALAIVLGSDNADPAPDITSGFEYSNEATPGRIATATPITAPYFGHTDELWPEADITSGFEYNNETTPGRIATATPITAPYFGYSPELNPDH